MPHTPTIAVGLRRDAPYRSRLSARSALYTELGLLLHAATGAGDASFRSLVVEDNCLARPSLSARKKLWEELHARYLLEPAHPIFATFFDEWARADSDAERGLTAYILLALNDKLVMDLGLELLFPRLRRAPAPLRVDDVLAFFHAARSEHPELTRWSVSTTTAVAQKYCASVRDFGLATGIQNKQTRRPALYGGPVRLLIRALRRAGTGALDLLAAPAFKLLALDGPDEVIAALGELNRQGALRFRMQGDVVELDLQGPTHG